MLALAVDASNNEPAFYELRAVEERVVFAFSRRTRHNDGSRCDVKLKSKSLE